MLFSTFRIYKPSRHFGWSLTGGSTVYKLFPSDVFSVTCLILTCTSMTLLTFIGFSFHGRSESKLGFSVYKKKERVAHHCALRVRLESGNF